MKLEFIKNGAASGDVGQFLLNNDFNLSALRPYRGTPAEQAKIGKNNSFVTVTNSAGKLVRAVTNAPATLTYEDWRTWDNVVMMAARQRLGFVNFLRGKGLVYNLPNGMSKMTLSYEKATEAGKARVSMDGLGKTDSDRPESIIENVPLPIVHEDFSIPMRQLSVSRNGRMPYDTTMLERAGRRVAEAIEKLALGTYGQTVFGNGNVYGLTNFPDRMTYTIQSPAASGWTPDKTVNDIMHLKQLSQNTANQYGPWVLFTNTAFDEYMDRDYSAAKGDNTLRDRIKKIQGIQDVITLDFLPSTGFHAILMQLSGDTMREIIGQDITTVQWPTQGGFELNFKVLGIMVPNPRSDAYAKCGIVHGSV